LVTTANILGRDYSPIPVIDSPLRSEALEN